MKNQAYDLIGDIHGQHDKLLTLLHGLGYRPRGYYAGWEHPEGRKVIFLGDYIDRGPKIREVLHEVRGMMEAGDALGIMGNHELNAILYQMPDGHGDWLRPHTEKNVKQHRATLEAFAGREEEWAEWIEWMKGLPMYLDLGALRAVHASWDPRTITWLENWTDSIEDLLRASAVKGSFPYRAIENLLKGPELELPEGRFYHDKEGIRRKQVRARWWNLPEGPAPIGPLVMPVAIDLAHEVSAEQLGELPNYGPEEPPVFFGHYWIPPDRPKVPLAANVASLDYSAGLGDAPLVAYRWDGERVLSPAKFFSVAP